MKEENLVRKPRQKRSELTRENIVNTALELFCKNGYHKTTTNEIARSMNISIGNLYFYFPNKESIFLEILEHYHQTFLNIHEAFLEKMEQGDITPHDFLKNLIEVIIKHHEESKELNREIQILSYSNPEVAEILEHQREKTEQAALRYIEKYKNNIQINDLETASVIIFSLMNSIVDRIVFSKESGNRDKLISETVRAAEAYLFANYPSHPSDSLQKH